MSEQEQTSRKMPPDYLASKTLDGAYGAAVGGTIGAGVSVPFLIAVGFGSVLPVIGTAIGAVVGAGLVLSGVTRKRG